MIVKKMFGFFGFSFAARASLAFAFLAFASVSVSPALAEGEEGTPHYPLIKPKEQSWSFAGPFGKWDQAQLQRGLKIYTEVCAACHSLNLVSYRNLADLGYNAAQIKAYAAEYEVTDGPNEDGEMFDRPARPADRFVSPFANDNEARFANNGALPPDLSLIAKARAPERGFPTFIFDIFTQYAESGPDYLHALLTGYEEAPEGLDTGELHYNPYFISGNALAMAPPLEDGLVTYDDGTPETLDQYSRDVSAFLLWAAEPTLQERKRLGFIVMAFLLLLTGLLYASKKKVWANRGASAGGGAGAGGKKSG